MNIALPALLIFLLLLPGFIFRSRYKRAERSSLDYSPFGQVVTEGVLWALCAHIVWLFLSYLLFSKCVDSAALLTLLTASSKDQSEAIAAVARDSRWITSYFVTIVFASFTISSAARHLISRFRLDRASCILSPLFRFHHAPWYYLLTGADFEEESEPDFIVVSAVVNIAGEGVLYTGVLSEFFANAEGQLDRLILRDVMRRPISKDKEPIHVILKSESESRFYPIDGDYFVLRYEEAITLNVEYVRLVEPPTVEA